MTGTSSCKTKTQELCFALFRRNDQWQQVMVTHCIVESGGVIKNTIVCPDGTELVVAASLLRFDGRIKRFVPHPEA
jgi:hypothetical protein